jgi:DNA-binding transcriptional ArsR family regulator/rhodanese-related sulfurtransferase
MEKRVFKNKVYSLLSQMVKAMANPHRLEIIDLLGQSGRTVEEIASETEMSIANASQHLQVLKASNLVEVQREGNYIRYHLANDNIFKTWSALREVGFERVAEINKLMHDYREKKSVLEAITIDELVTRMKSKNTVLLDIRPIEEFNSGHIAGALSVPLETLSAMIKTLPKNKFYIAYCRGPLCVFADEAVSILNKKGYKATRLDEGFPDWKLRGLAVHEN